MHFRREREGRYRPNRAAGGRYVIYSPERGVLEVTAGVNMTRAWCSQVLDQSENNFRKNATTTTTTIEGKLQRQIE